jgi:hypothetical protein
VEHQRYHPALAYPEQLVSLLLSLLIVTHAVLKFCNAGCDLGRMLMIVLDLLFNLGTARVLLCAFCSHSI